MNYKPFNLEEAKNGKRIVCRDGKPAKFIAHVPDLAKGQRVVFIREDRLWLTTEMGYDPEAEPHCADIFMAEAISPNLDGGWYVKRAYGGLGHLVGPYKTESEAKDDAAFDNGKVINISECK